MLRRLWNISQKYNYGEDPTMKQWFEQIYQSAVSRKTYKRLVIRGYLNLICASMAERSVLTEEKEETVQKERDIMSVMDDMKYVCKRAEASQNKTDPRIQ